jgi:RND family efflux transporter MFP subunit
MPTITFLNALAVALVLVAAGCSGKHEQTQTGALPRTVEAHIAILQPRQAATVVVTPGSVIAAESVQVASRLMGYIKDIAVSEGQSVKTGQRLFSIDPLDIEGAVVQARLGLKQAEDAVRDAKADFDRFEALHKEEVVTRQHFEKMKLNYEIAVSRAAQAKAGLDTAQGQMRYATVTSPISGVVTRKLANEGDIAAPGHPVVMVENPARLQVQTSVGDDLFRMLKPGLEVAVEVDGHAVALPARVAHLSPAADPIAHTFLVKLDLAAAGLRSGTFARVLFPTGTRTMLAVPEGAVLERAGIAGVFVVDAQDIAQYRMVRTGPSQDGEVEILAGLNPGERLVTGNADAVNNGDKVVAPRTSVQPAATPAAPAAKG